VNGTLRIDWHAGTDVGAVRKVNEDSFSARPERGIWAVADGMGGHAHGDWASSQIAQALDAIAPHEDFNALIEAAAQAIHKANAIVCAEAVAKEQRMGSTVVVLVVQDRRFGVLWAGDSRIYLVRGGQLLQMTRDHTMVQDMVDRGLISEDEAHGHPMNHVLARAVGVEETLLLDAVVDDIQPGDTFLLCSDGVYGMVPDSELLDIIMQTEVNRLPDTLIARCLERHAPDNVTAIVVRAHEPTLLVLAPQTAALS
jgi:serine/threonine protein phosphatase Stp1